VKLAPLTASPAAGALGRTRNRRKRASCSVPVGVDYLSVAPVPGYEPGTGASPSNIPFSGLDSRLPSRARLDGVLDSEDGRNGVRRNRRRIDRRPTDARGLPRIIAVFDERGAGGKARPVRRRAAV